MPYVVYDTGSGEAISYGSVLAENLPPNVAVFEIDQATLSAICLGYARWNGSAVVPVLALPAALDGIPTQIPGRYAVEDNHAIHYAFPITVDGELLIDGEMVEV